MRIFPTIESSSSRLKRSGRAGNAFTLLEVMIAVAIFVMAMFAILNLVTQNLRAARSLKSYTLHAGSLAAGLVLSNTLAEGTEIGDFEELFPSQFPDHTWAREITWAGSNGLFQVDFMIYRKGETESALTILIYKPLSPAPKR